MNASRWGMASRLALESAVIIASILAAFALDTWWGGVQERREERETLQALHAEFRAARENILRYREAQTRVLRSAAVVGDSLDRALKRGDRFAVVPDTTLVLAHLPPTTTVRLGTLDGLIGSGRLGIIRDRRLRSALGGWGSELAELAEEEITSRDLAYGDLDRVLRVRTNTWDLWARGDSVYDGHLSPESRPLARRIPADTEILGIFSLRHSILSHAMEEFDALVQEVDTILALIGESL